jgi:uncharacterized protein with PIN domain
MVLDTSALVAVLFDEPERWEFVRKIAAAPRRLISSGTLVESRKRSSSRPATSPPSSPPERARFTPDARGLPRLGHGSPS